MDAALIAPPRRLSVPIDNRWGAGEMSVLDFGDEKRPVDLIFVHANGFNAATYRSLLAPLSGSLRIWAPDLRGHGRTRLPTTTAGRVRWHDHRDDLIALLDAVDGPPLALAGHSMGGTSSLLASAERSAAVSRLVMLDPVIMPRHVTAMFQLPLMDRIPRRMAITRGALKRRRDFDNREQALASWRGRGAFKGWSEMMLADYVSEAFEDVDGGVRLVCTPEWEASNYASQSHNPWRALRRFDRPIRVLKAGRGSTCALTPGMHGLPNLTVETVTEGTHLFPMLMLDIARDALFEAAV